MARRKAPGEILADEIKRDLESLVVPVGSLIGQPVTVLPWEWEFLRETFDPVVRTSVLSVPRRQGKTFVCAGIGISAMCGALYKPGALSVCAARSRKQARILFDYASKMIRASGIERTRENPEGLVEIKESAGVLVGSVTEGFDPPELHIMSAEASTAVGFGPYIALIDELGEVKGPTDALYENISTGMGSYEDGKEIILSSQAKDDAALLSTIIDAAEQDETVHVTLYAAPEDAAWDDEEVWKACNPSLGHNRSLADLRSKAKRARLAPSLRTSFKNRFLNQRVSSEDGLFDPTAWKACDSPVDLEVFHRGRVVAGLDLAMRKDLAALVLLAGDPDDPDAVHCLVFAWTPKATLLERAGVDRAPYDTWAEQGLLTPLEGNVMRIDALAELVVAELERFDVERCYLDRYRLEEFLSHVDDLTDGALTMRHDDPKQGDQAVLQPCGQGFYDFTTALDALDELVLEERLVHGGHPVLTMAISNAVVATNASGDRKLVKDRSTGRIDPAVALAMAAKAWIDAEAPESLADSVGVLFANDGTSTDGDELDR